MLTLFMADFYGYLHQGFWPFLRIISLLSLAPLYQEKGVNNKLKTGLALCITLLVAPLLPPVETAILSLDGVLLAGLQLLIGMAMAMTMQLIFVAVRHTGEIVGLQMGLSFGSFYDPSVGQNMPVVSRILNLFAMLLFFYFNGHLLIIEAVAASFQLLPVKLFSLSGEGLGQLLTFSSVIFWAGVKLALPVISVLLCINLSLGLVNRLIPSLSIFVVGFPLSLSIGMLMLGGLLVSFPAFFELLLEKMFAALSQLLLRLEAPGHDA